MVHLMARPRSSNPKTRPVTVKMSEAEVAALDERRGSTSRSTYLRLLFVQGGHPHPEPHPEPLNPVDPPIPSPIVPPVPPPNPVETFTPPIPDQIGYTQPVIACRHTWVKAGSAFDRCTACDDRRPHQAGTR